VSEVTHFPRILPVLAALLLGVAPCLQSSPAVQHPKEAAAPAQPAQTGTAEPVAAAPVMPEDAALTKADGAAPAKPEDAAPAKPEATAKAKSQSDLLRIERGEGLLPLLIPRDEELIFNVRVDLGIGMPKLGTVTLTSKVEPHRGSLLVRDPKLAANGEAAELAAIANGGNAFYRLLEHRTSRLQPQAWPNIVHQSTQTGTENRKREQHIGFKEQGYVTRFRNDGHCRGCDLQTHFVEGTWTWSDPKHCKSCKSAEHRVWRDLQERPIPVGTVDMVTAVALARSMVLEDVNEVTFPLIDEEELWNLTVSRGENRRIEVDAGRFDATHILLDTQPAAGENAKPEDFHGLFGIHGTVSIWFDTKTGVPVLISGNVPLGPITLTAEVQLASYRGTPEGFAPAP
jgi:hypothetical protein